MRYFVVFASILLAASSAAAAAPSHLIATGRTDTALSVQWDANGHTLFTLDVLGPEYFGERVPTCGDFPQHPDIIETTSSARTVEGLRASTWYQLHVHALPHDTKEGASNVILVKTRAAGLPLEPLAGGSPDYVICTSAGPNPPVAPNSLVATTDGSTVTLRWNGVTAATGYRVDAGSQAGATDLGRFETGSTQTTFVATAVPIGTYYVRVRAIGPNGLSDHTNEVVVTVGGPCARPAAPTAFTFSVDGPAVTLTWSASPNLTRFLLEAGAAPGLGNIAVIVLEPGTRGLTVAAPPGTYYVRVRAGNNCGTSDASVELVITVR